MSVQTEATRHSQGVLEVVPLAAVAFVAPPLSVAGDSLDDGIDMLLRTYSFHASRSRGNPVRQVAAEGTVASLSTILDLIRSEEYAEEEIRPRFLSR